MSSLGVGGDLVLALRPVSAEAFAPHGRVLGAGARVRIGGRTGAVASAAVLVAIDAREAAPRRVTSLQRFPDERRLVVAMSESGFAVVVAGKAERPAAPPAAFVVPGGSGIALDAGVWHAGPLPLGDGAILEASEVAGAADRVDRVTTIEAFGVPALRLATPDEESAPSAGFDLADESAVALGDGVAGRLALGCLTFDDVGVGESDEAQREEGERLALGLRVHHGPDVAPSRIPGLELVRDLYKGLGIDPTKTRPSSEALLRRVLQGRSLPRVNNLVDAVNLTSLRTLVPFGAYDRARLSAPVVVRRGAPGEGYEGIGRGRIDVEGRPVLADREGPFGNPTADSLRTAVGPGTTRALVVLYLPASLDDGVVTRFLDATSLAVRKACGGTESGRRVVR